MQILIVEDESTIREVEKAYLERAGYSVVEAENGESALQKFADTKIDLVLLDLNLPKLDGINVCKQIRAKSGVPIIMVTARVEEMDELIGLEIGADDYIKKPFSPSVLVARVQTLLRRVGDSVLKIADLEIDPEKMTVTKAGKLINLTTTQFNILYTLARTPGKVFTRDQIMEHAYADPAERDVLDRTIDVHIKSIRKLLETNPKHPKYILTMIGKGYKFNEN